MKLIIVPFIAFCVFMVGVLCFENMEFNNTYKYVQDITKYQIKNIENKGYLSEDDKALIESEIKNRGVECKVSGTSSKVSKEGNVFLNIDIYTENYYGGKAQEGTIFLTGTAR